MLVLLFDIDGTLLNSGGSGQAAMEAVLQRDFGANRPVVGIATAGRTDRAITADLLTFCEVPTDELTRERFLAAYLAELPLHLARQQGVVLPGVRELLSALAGREDVVIGLLTGNFAEGARVKLAHFELHHHFAFGGYGDHHPDRDDVARVARELVRERHPHVVDERVWVIGDTPADIRCARAIGAKVLAVATGIYAAAELEPHAPDVLLQDLSDVPEVLKSFGLS